LTTGNCIVFCQKIGLQAVGNHSLARWKLHPPATHGGSASSGSAIIDPRIESRVNRSLSWSRVFMDRPFYFSNVDRHHQPISRISQKVRPPLGLTGPSDLKIHLSNLSPTLLSLFLSRSPISRSLCSLILSFSASHSLNLALYISSEEEDKKERGKKREIRKEEKGRRNKRREDA
jgi:hypothetical protein